MKTTIILIRHGETDWNASQRWQGQSDIPLNENGREQARKLASRLADWPIDAIYSSDLKRAKETAKILGESMSIEPIFEPAWRERNGGRFEGMTSQELNNLDKQRLEKLRDKDWAPPGGESNSQVAQRVWDSFERIVDRHQGDVVAIVTHGGTMLTLMSMILGFGPGERARLWVSHNTGFSIVEVGERGPYLVRLNDASHLNDGSGLTG